MTTAVYQHPCVDPRKQTREAIPRRARSHQRFVRTKTRFHPYLAAPVANLTLVAAQAGLTGETGVGLPSAGSANSSAAWLGQIEAFISLASASLPNLSQ